MFVSPPLPFLQNHGSTTYLWCECCAAGNQTRYCSGSHKIGTAVGCHTRALARDDVYLPLLPPSTCYVPPVCTSDCLQVALFLALPCTQLEKINVNDLRGRGRTPNTLNSEREAPTRLARMQQWDSQQHEVWGDSTTPQHQGEGLGVCYCYTSKPPFPIQ